MKRSSMVAVLVLLATCLCAATAFAAYNYNYSITGWGFGDPSLAPSHGYADIYVTYGSSGSITTRTSLCGVPVAGFYQFEEYISVYDNLGNLKYSRQQTARQLINVGNNWLCNSFTYTGVNIQKKWTLHYAQQAYLDTQPIVAGVKFGPDDEVMP